jgi:hypothetical protein
MLPFQPVPDVIGRVLEVGVADIVRVHPDRPLAAVPAPIGAFGVTVGVKGRSVVSQPSHLHAVMLDSPGVHLEELIRQLR